MNNFSYLFLVFLTGGLILQCYLGTRHIRHIKRHRNAVPGAFSGKIPLPAHQKAADYSVAKTRAGLVELAFGTVLVLIWTLGGLLDVIDVQIRSLELDILLTGTFFILTIILLSSLFELPLTLYRTFGLEQRFGFNKMTISLYIKDQVKNAVLLLLIGAPLVLLILWIMENTGALWWLYVWITWLVFSLVMMWVWPAFIAPLFNQFRPLENPELKTRIENLLQRNGFASQGIFVMDGSTRSTHGNAYFTGIGDNKRIVFFDTLIDELDHEEIEAVLAHELGHFKCHHIKKRILVIGSVFLAGFAVLGYLINKSWFYSGLGASQQSTYMALTLFFIAAPAFTFMLQPLFSFTSRKHEFEADDFAAKQAHTENLIHALVKLYRENANTLTPDPLYSAFHDSHPPAPVRVAHLHERQASQAASS